MKPKTLEWWVSWIERIEDGVPEITWTGPWESYERAEEEGMTYDTYHPSLPPPPEWRLPKPGLFIWSVEKGKKND